MKIEHLPECSIHLVHSDFNRLCDVCDCGALMAAYRDPAAPESVHSAWLKHRVGIFRSMEPDAPKEEI